jgi:hypothetical protein
MEGAHYIKSKKLLSFSEQQLVDCVSSSYGCDGGNTDKALLWLEDNYAELESVYPYTGKDGTCQQASKKKTTVKSTNLSHPTPKSSSALKASIAVGPTSVSIDAHENAFSLYKTGVITGSACGTNLGHAVLAVGYGT